MNLAIPIGDYRLIGYEDYEPVSEVGEKLTRKWAQEKNYLKGSASDWLPTITAAFREIRNDCHKADWDGQGALAITSRVIATTENAVRALFALLPKGTPAPEVIPEADGEVCLSWVVDGERQLSLSFGAHDKINFAGQFGKGGSIHGWQPIDTTSPSALDKSLQDVAKHLARLYPPIISRRAA